MPGKIKQNGAFNAFASKTLHTYSISTSNNETINQFSASKQLNERSIDEYYWKNKYERVENDDDDERRPKQQQQQINAKHRKHAQFCASIAHSFRLCVLSFSFQNDDGPRSTVEEHAAWKPNKSNKSHRTLNICVFILRSISQRHCLLAILAQAKRFVRLFLLSLFLFFSRFVLS